MPEAIAAESQLDEAILFAVRNWNSKSYANFSDIKTEVGKRLLWLSAKEGARL